MRPLGFLGVLVLLSLVPLVPAGGKKEPKIPLTGPSDLELAPFDELMTEFVEKNQVPGASLAVTKNGQLVYARGFGFADPDHGEKVLPRSRFRIASISKPITAAAILKLIEQGRLKLSDCPFDILNLTPPPGSEPDPRLKKVTIQQLLQHTGGWDRKESFDPMFRPIRIAKELGTQPPAGPEVVTRYMLGQKLDFDPGSRFAYSNFGYCVLGRVIEKITRQPYEAFVTQQVLAPLGMKETQLGKTLERARGEVRYFDEKHRTAPAVLGPKRGEPVPLPYGTWYLEAMDAHGGWISSAVDLVKFASALDRPDKCKILKPESIHQMFARPDGPAGLDNGGKPKDVYYGLGWQVRVVNPQGAVNTWHTGSLDGTATILVRRSDGLCWAVLFNSRNNAQGLNLTGLIDPMVHQAANRVKRWPAKDLFGKDF